MTTVQCSLDHVNSENMVFEDTHTAADEASYMAIRQAELNYWLDRAERLVEESLELLAEEIRWQDSLESLDHLTHEQRAQALGLRLCVA